MGRLFIAARAIGSWRDRLANPDLQWARKHSAFETAVSWESASRAKSGSGIPAKIEQALGAQRFENPILLFAVAEHKVELEGDGHPSQCDVWAVVDTSLGALSLTVEAKAAEPFGDKSLKQWLKDGRSEEAKENRKVRWAHIRGNLPERGDGAYDEVRYQLLHRCAASVIESRRLRYRHAAFVVQEFIEPNKNSEAVSTGAKRSKPDQNFEDFARFCSVVKISAVRNSVAATKVGDVSLNVGWVTCDFAADREIADIA